MSEIKGYKVFESDWTCRGYQYKVGGTFEHDGNIELCGKGFHFCKVASDCFNYYNFDPRNKVAEVLATGLCETEGDKTVTNKLTIVREITWEELLTIVNTGKACTGLCNTGNRNTGDENTGNCNTGDWNTGDCNTGNRNTGDWNIGHYNTGFFSTVTPKITLFEKETDLTPCEVRNIRGIEILNWNYENNWWIYESNMSEEEKAAHPSYKTTGGFLKSIPFKDACKLMWLKLSDNEKELVKKIPNFDARIFREITGIEV